MADACIEKVDDLLSDWFSRVQLPMEAAGYRLNTQRCLHDMQYDFFRYEAPDMHRGIVGFYDTSMGAYKLCIHIGVVSYCLPSFIHGDLETFGHTLKSFLPSVLEGLCTDVLQTEELSALCEDLKTWAYAENLPHECEGFTLFIRPEAPAALTNGSYLIIDYADFSRKCDLGIYYNLYRDEFFCEYHVFGMPHVSYDFDATDLDMLAQRLELYLVRYLGYVAAEAADKEQCSLCATE